MSDGFRNVRPAGAVTVQGPGLGAFRAVPIGFVATNDVSQFAALEIAMVGIGGAGGLAGLQQVQFLWFNSNTFTTLTWVDTVEFNYETVGGFLGKQSFVRTPVRGAYLQIVGSTTTTPPAAPQLLFNVYGLSETVPNLICWNDQANFQGTDLIVLGQSGGAIASGGSAGPFNSGLHSGQVMVQANIAWATGAVTAGQARLRFFFGSSGVGWPDLYINQPTAAYALAVSNFFIGFMPRRPIICTLTDTAGGVHNAINSWNLSVIRDEP